MVIVHVGKKMKILRKCKDTLEKYFKLLSGGGLLDECALTWKIGESI